MRNDFEYNDFEAFLQDQVKNQKMYPSDRVWRNIDKKMHRDRRWPALTVAAFAILSASFFVSVYFPSRSSLFSVVPKIEPLTSATHRFQAPENKENVLNKLTTSAAFTKSANLTNINEKLPLEAPVSSLPAEVEGDMAYLDINRSSVPDEVKLSAGTASLENEHKIRLNIKYPEKLVPQEKAPEINIPLEEPKPLLFNNTNKETTFIQKSADPNDRNIADKFIAEQNLVFSAPKRLKAQSLKNKFSYQFYAAPSVSYRKLNEDKALLKNGSTTGPVGLNYVTNVNNVVRHRPGTGVEAGFALMYHISENFRLKSGAQFNVRQYTIEAYNATMEMASIALIESNRIDTIRRIAMYRNNNGYSSAKLYNRYYQIAVPLGVEWQFAGKNNVQFNIAASIQPTYLINDNAYLLSTNFKNYTESPDMVRKWNLNSNLEAFVSFRSGDVRWQVGPQVRYQPYSTFIPQYPIKEHLLDYGVKVAVSQIIRKKE